jgi:hypothetical protein
MIDIDRVYQKVLALCNKEQKGYFTPQQFNLFAHKAQMEIFDGYFHDMKMAYHKPKNDMGVAFDEIELIQEKLHPFWQEMSVVVSLYSVGIGVIPGGEDNIEDVFYKIQNIYNNDEKIAEEVSGDEFYRLSNHPLLTPSSSRPVYVREKGNVFISSNYVNTKYFKVLPAPLTPTNWAIHGWGRPATPNWAYVVVQERALYNGNLSVHFQLHASEEEKLVARLLQLAGVAIAKPGLVEVGMTDGAQIKQSQND